MQRYIIFELYATPLLTSDTNILLMLHRQTESRPFGRLCGVWVGRSIIVPENVAVLESVVACEDVAGESLVVDVVADVVGHVAQGVAVALVEDVLGEVFLAVPFALIGIREAAHVRGAANLQPRIDGFLAVVVLVKLDILADAVEVLAREAFVVKLAGEVLEVLKHQLRVFLVGVESAAVTSEIVVAVEGGKVDPLTVEAAAVVLAVCSAVDGGVLVAVVGVVVFVSLHELFGGEAEVFKTLLLFFGKGLDEIFKFHSRGILFGFDCFVKDCSFYTARQSGVERDKASL